MIQLLSAALLPTLVIIAGFGDVLALRIPNKLTILTAILFFPMALLTLMPWGEIGLHVLVGIALFILGFVLFSMKLFGGGDAKLLAAAGLWFGPTDILQFIVLTTFAGGILALFVGIWSMVSLSMEVHDSPLYKRFRALKPNVPYGYAFAFGAIAVWPQTWWMLPHL